MFVYILLAGLVTIGQCWLLISSETSVTLDVTKDVTLRCFHNGVDNDSPIIIDQLSRIRLVKIFHANTVKTYAEMFLARPSDVVLTHPNVPGVDASGHVGQVNDTFLSVTWSTASEDTLGSYKCEITGFDKETDEQVQVNTNSIQITRNEEISPRYLLNLLIQIAKKSDNFTLDTLKQQLINSNLMQKVQSEIEQINNETGTLSKQFNELEDQLENKYQNVTKAIDTIQENAVLTRNQTDSMSKDLRNLKEENEEITINVDKLKSSVEEKRQETELLVSSKLNALDEKSDRKHLQLNKSIEEVVVKYDKLVKRVNTLMSDVYTQLHPRLGYWPSGKFSLLSPSYGCPDTPYSKLDSGFFKIETQTTKKPQHNFASHMSENIYTRIGSKNVLDFQYCTNSRSEPAMDWPKGSYCLNTWPCPKGFGLGELHFMLDSTTAANVSKSNVYDPMGSNRKRLWMIFCCRHDGSADKPILLPNGKPFYLLRHKGKCQKVAGTEVTNESFYLDTDKHKKTILSEEFLADISIDNGLLTHMCYYEKARLP